MVSKCKCFSNGIMLLLVWSILLHVAAGFITIVIQLLLWDIKQQYILIVWSGLWVLLPVAGWMGDSFLGRYRAITVGVFLNMLSFLILLCATVMLQFNWTPIPAIALLCFYIVVTTCSVGSYTINMLPFITDQMIGASADDISAVVQWYYWSIILGTSSYFFLIFIPRNQLNLLVYLPRNCISLFIVSSNNRLSVPQMA